MVLRMSEVYSASLYKYSSTHGHVVEVLESKNETALNVGVIHDFGGAEVADCQYIIFTPQEWKSFIDAEYQRLYLRRT
jgi:hypothetical protein